MPYAVLGTPRAVGRPTAERAPFLRRLDNLWSPMGVFVDMKRMSTRG
jgi:hypothetical protein